MDHHLQPPSFATWDQRSVLSEVTLVDSRPETRGHVQDTDSTWQLTIENPPKTRSKLQLFVVLLALYFSLFLAALDQSIVATAVPTIASELNSSRGYVWIGSAYLLASAASGPIWSNVSDIFGRKSILLAAVFLFFASSIVCALANSMELLIVGRAFQGTAGGGLIQLVNITISDMFSVRSRSLYLGLLEVMWAIAGGVGPVMGGTFTQFVTWRWCFWINLPISGLTFIMLFFFLDVHNPKTHLLDGIKAIDWFGTFAILSCTIMLFVGLDLGGVTYAWNSPQVICLIVFGSLSFGIFIYCEKKARYPLMPLDLLSEWSNVASLFLTMFHGMVYMGQEYYLPLYFQSALSASPVWSGALVLPITVSEALMGIFCGILIHRTGRYLEVTYFGCVLMTLGVGLYTIFSTTTSIATIIGIELIAGLGAGCLFEPPLIALHAFVDQDRTASATSTMGFTRNVAQALSLVLGGVVVQNSIDLRIPTLLKEGVAESITSLFSNGMAAANVMAIATIEDPAQQFAVKGAFIWGLRNMWIMYTCLSVMACITSVFIGKRVLGTVHTETKTGLH